MLELRIETRADFSGYRSSLSGIAVNKQRVNFHSAQKGEEQRFAPLLAALQLNQCLMAIRSVLDRRVLLQVLRSQVLSLNSFLRRLRHLCPREH